MESFQAHGLWWLPEHQEHRVPGVLSWDEESGGTLRLVGQLWPIVIRQNILPNGNVQKVRDRSHEADRSYPVVHGEAEGAAYTLVNSFQSAKRDWSLEQTSETVHVNAVVKGAFFEAPDLQVGQAVFRVRDLAGWVGTSGLELTYPDEPWVGDQYALVSATRLPRIVVPSAGPSVILSHSLEVSLIGNEFAGIDQDWVLCINQVQSAPLQTLVDVASDFQDLVTIAVERTAEFRGVVLHHPDVPESSLGGHRVRGTTRELNYYTRWANRVDYGAEGATPRNPVTRHEMFFTFEQVGVEGVGRWLDTAARFRTELRRAMTTRYSRGYLEDRIMNLCAALESFDKQRRGTKDVYVGRIVACIQLAGKPFHDLIVEDPGEWARRARDLRNTLAHHDEQLRLDGSAGGHLVSEQLYWLFALCMLRVADAPDAVFRSIANHQQWGWLREQAKERADPGQPDSRDSAANRSRLVEEL